ncbi:alpha amylase catalytic region [Gloeothece citriformis PCC 7424]|uniref:1,4-alpha-glucan branching enzyme n=1 Tax=Gloeothece citriformis (strain PCC 7424) TaxID=65393 RepID=B7KBU7_GLOC7|nr:alpha-amylase family glycosyl hydrolase [Gloeothece citriformis]ACK73075.1 alpha amylase catalytic region [Gloeothece citriformis PCC 7424]
MAKIPVTFTYLTGLTPNIFSNARLSGSWDNQGNYSQEWTTTPMEQIIADDGCPAFRATVELDDSQIGQQFRWGVILDNPAGADFWGITTEINDGTSQERYRTFTLTNQPQPETYYLTHCRRLGSRKVYPNNQQTPGVQFAVWCPNAQNVEVAFGNSANGYIADDGYGIDSNLPIIALNRGQEGVWQTDPNNPTLSNFSPFDHKPYMFRVTKDDGTVAYRTDLYSQCQIGSGNFNPNGGHFDGSYTELDGTKSCSVVVDTDMVAKNFSETVWPEHEFIPASEFWQDELNPDRPLPTRVEDLVIYELHLGALGYGKDRPGTLGDAMELLEKGYFEELGINAIELLPMSEFRDEANWGYETSHYFALEYSAGGRDQLKHFIKACHQRGIAVILDVVYNHYSPDGERAQWGYDSNAPERNIYYWYEGDPNSYRYSDGRPFPEGGYIDNMSTGYSPRFHEEMVRKLFISSAATLLSEFHVDGFRADQTTSMHSYNVLHADGRSMGNVNQFGAKFLREWSRTLKLIKPTVMLMAEDHSDWNLVTVSAFEGGLGFDAAWYSEFYHHLIGDTRQGNQYAKLIPTAGYGDNRPLAMDYFAGALGASGDHKVVYHESHDEAGNASYMEGGQRIESRRTIVSAVNGATLTESVRPYAEARTRFACGMTLLSAGTPMFFMAEEIGAQKQYRYGDFINNREDLLGERVGEGRFLFQYYGDIIRLRLNHSGLRSHNIDIVYVHNANRIIAFRRWDDREEFLIVGSLSNFPFTDGYTIENSRLSNGLWREIFNSDAQAYRGNNLGNGGATIPSNNGRMNVIIPANSVVVFQKF